MAFGGQWGGLWVAPTPPVNPFVTGPLISGPTLTLYVDSVAGNDANPGTQAQPFRTLDRAQLARRQYSTLYRGIAIQLVGVGPYQWGSTIVATLSAAGAYLQILGDMSVETVHASGTFTGDMTAGGSVGTSAGLGSDTQRGRHLLITSGNCNGACVPVCENTDTSVTVVNRRFRTALGAIANGDTFRIITPGTQLTVTFNMNNVEGGYVSTGTVVPSVIFHRVHLNGATFSVNGSTAAFASCTATPNATISGGSGINGGAVTSALAAATGLSTNQLSSCGLIFQGSVSVDQRSSLVGTFAFSSTSAITCTNQSAMELHGARVRASGLQASRGGSIFFAGSPAGAEGVFRVDCQTLALEGGNIYLGNSGSPYALLFWAVTAANSACFRITRGGNLYWRITASVSPTGGASAASSFAVDASGGGRVWITGNTPTLTGGTAGRDLKTSGASFPLGAPNAQLNADNTTVDAVSPPFGDVLCRVPFS